MSLGPAYSGLQLPNPWHAIIAAVLRGIRAGEITITMPDGRSYHFVGPRPGPSAAIAVRDGRRPETPAFYLPLALVPREPPMFGARPAILDADLSFKLSDVSDGDYLLRVSGLPPDAYVSSAVMGKRDVLNDGVSLRGNAEPLRVIVSAPGGRIEGAVVDDSEQPSPGVRIVLVPEESHWKRQDLFRVTSSDQYAARRT